MSFASRSIRVLGWVCSVCWLVACGVENMPGENVAGDGAVAVTKQALGPSPDSDCDYFAFGGRDYWFCDSERNWSTARTRCQTIGLDLVRIGSASENAFVLSHITDDSWTGGTDVAIEGAWRWIDNGAQFWQGAANGSAVAGAYNNWKTGQPANTNNQDCQTIEDGAGNGKWNDEACSGNREYVCEGIVDLCPSDPTKTAPGQCGCGVPDIDSDGDTVANCIDGCPAHAAKTAPGQCGCAVPDTDGDGDGVANCVDACPADPGKSVPGVCGCGIADGDSDGDGAINCEDLCPNDPTKVEPGDCGCANAPAANGTACDDGLCAANTQCNGAGQCGSPQQCGVPDSNCEFHWRGGTAYWFCENDRQYDNAQARCESVGMDLVIIESEGEDDFVTEHADEHSFMGGTDRGTEGTWVWTKTGVTFWQGDETGAPVGGAYTNFKNDEPDDVDDDCIAKSLVADGQWKAHPCSFDDAFVCERQDECPFSSKFAKGECGCAVEETDVDGDDTPDCVDGCPRDPLKTEPGVTGCNVPETHTDTDGTPDADDLCPADPKNVFPGDCGCAGTSSLQPAGTACDDSFCGAGTCNGQGTCVSTTSSCGSGLTGCVERRFDGHVYWFCPGPRSWDLAVAACRTVPGGSLVRINDAFEQTFVRGQLTTNAWIGGSDRGLEGAWRWANRTSNDGVQFASGGNALSGRFTAFAAGQPNGGTNEGCLFAFGPAGSAPGRWSDGVCTTSLAFVCETGDPALLPDPPVNTGDGVDVIHPGGGTQTSESWPINCVDAIDPAMPQTFEEADAQRQDPNTLFGAVPPPGSTCPPSAPGLASYGDTALCALDHNLPMGTTPCTSSSECGAGQVCGRPECEPVSPDGRCSPGPNVCGTPVAGCSANDTLPVTCQDIALCIEPADQIDRQFDASGLQPAPFNGPPITPRPDEPIGEYQDSPNGAAPGYPSCSTGTNHCWCDLTMPIADVQGTDTRSGSTNPSAMVYASFSPHVLFNADVDPLPFGDSEYNLTARAQLTVSAGVNNFLGFPALDASVTILDAVAAIEASRCDIDPGETKFTLFGADVIDPPREADVLPPAVTSGCRTAIDQYKELAGRAKKAFRDAEFVINKYNEYRANDQRFGPDFCSDLATEDDRPTDFEVDCTKPDEVLVNEFIEYYEKQVHNLRVHVRDVMALVDAGVAAAYKDIGLGAPAVQLPINFIDVSNSDSITIFQATVIIVFIPVTMEVEIIVSYGLTGQLNFQIGGARGIFAPVPQDGPSAPFELGSADVSVTPWANASLGGFVGVGFDFGPFECKAGIESRVTLVDVSAPQVAGVDLAMETIADERPLPDSLAEISTGEEGLKFPSRAYRLGLFWRFGSSVVLNNMLSGHLDGKVKIRLELVFVTISKQLSKRIISFKGLPIGGTFELATAEGEIGDGIIGPPGEGDGFLGAFEMQMPFVTFLPIEPGPDPSTLTPTTVDLGVVEEIFYDDLCVPEIPR